MMPPVRWTGREMGPFRRDHTLRNNPINGVSKGASREFYNATHDHHPRRPGGGLNWQRFWLSGRFVFVHGRRHPLAG